MKKWSIFLTIFFFSLFFCTLKYANMVRISNISFFRFCWKNEKLDWPNCARTCFVSSRFCFPQFPYSVLFLCSIQYFVTFHLFSSVLKDGIMWKWRIDDLTQALLNCLEKSLCKILNIFIAFFHQSHFASPLFPN